MICRKRFELKISLESKMKYLSREMIFLFVLALGVVGNFQEKKFVIEEDEAVASARASRRLADGEEREYRDRLLERFFLRGDQQQQGVLGALELVDGQESRLKEIREKFNSEMKELSRPPGNASPQQFRQWLNEEKVLQQQFINEIRECLLDSQVEALRNTDITYKGVAKLLVDSPMEQVLRIRPDQKERIRAASNRIAEKIAKFNQEIREESIAKIFRELDQEQKANLAEIYSIDLLNQYYEQRMIVSLFYDHNIDNEFDMKVQFDIEKEQ